MIGRKEKAKACRRPLRKERKGRKEERKEAMEGKREEVKGRQDGRRGKGRNGDTDLGFPH